MRPSYFTSPPPRKPLAKPARHPIFTSKFLSTKSFGPGHLFGTGILVIGTFAIAKAVIAHGQGEAARLLAQPARRRSNDVADAADNERGAYGKGR